MKMTKQFGWWLLLAFQLFSVSAFKVWAYPPAPASQAQVNVGTEPYLYVTPQTLTGWNTNRAASQLEVITGTVTNKYISPATLAGAGLNPTNGTTPLQVTNIALWAVAASNSVKVFQTAYIDPSGNDSTAQIGNMAKPFLTPSNAIYSGARKVVFNPGLYSVTNGMKIRTNQTVEISYGATITNYCVIGSLSGSYPPGSITNLLPLFGLSDNSTVVLNGKIIDGFWTNASYQVSAIGVVSSYSATNWLIAGVGEIIGYSECISVESTAPSSGRVAGIKATSCHSTFNIVGTHNVVIDGCFLDCIPTNVYSISKWCDVIYISNPSPTTPDNITVNNSVIGNPNMHLPIIPIRDASGLSNNITLNNVAVLNDGTSYKYYFDSGTEYPVTGSQSGSLFKLNNSISIKDFQTDGWVPAPGAAATPKIVFGYENTYINQAAAPHINELWEYTGSNTNYLIRNVNGDLRAYWTDVDGNAVYSRPILNPVGVTTNIQFSLGTSRTNTLYFTNGVLMRVTQP